MKKLKVGRHGAGNSRSTVIIIIILGARERTLSIRISGVVQNQHFVFDQHAVG